MDQQQQPKIPTLKDPQKPQLKMRGLGAGMTLFDRLKQFKKKDLAFILAGLGTLFMAPLAEHFMMSPEGGDPTMQQGWGQGRGRDIFGSGSSPYEPGSQSIAQGGAIGGSGDIITPLNVRDPSALVMGPGSTQQPPAGSIAPPTTPPLSGPGGPRSEPDLKDALAGAASRAAGAVAPKAPLSMPKVALGGSGLRGLGVAGGGSSASAGLAAPGSSPGGTPGTGGGGVNLARANRDYNGVARGGSNPQGLDRTKALAAAAGDNFNKPGSALNNLNEASKQQMGTQDGSSFGGRGGGDAGKDDKGPGGNGPGGSKNLGESLAYILAKERAMKELELEFEKRKLRDPELLWLNIRNDALKAIGQEVAKGLAKCATNPIACVTSASAASGIVKCGQDLPAVPKATAKSNECEGDDDAFCYKFSKSGNSVGWKVAPDKQIPCTISGESEKGEGEGAAKPAVTGNPANVSSGVSDTTLTQVNGLCTALKEKRDSLNDNKVAAENRDAQKAYYERQIFYAQNLLAARAALLELPGGVPAESGCTVAAPLHGVSVQTLHTQASTQLSSQYTGEIGALPYLAQAAYQKRDEAKASIDKSVEKLNAARETLEKAKAQLIDVETNKLGKIGVFSISEEDKKAGAAMAQLTGKLELAKQSFEELKKHIGTQAQMNAPGAAGAAPSAYQKQGEFQRAYDATLANARDDAQMLMNLNARYVAVQAGAAAVEAEVAKELYKKSAEEKELSGPLVYTEGNNEPTEGQIHPKPEAQHTKQAIGGTFQNAVLYAEKTDPGHGPLAAMGQQLGLDVSLQQPQQQGGPSEWKVAQSQNPKPETAFGKLAAAAKADAAEKPKKLEEAGNEAARVLGVGKQMFANTKLVIGARTARLTQMSFLNRQLEDIRAPKAAVNIQSGALQPLPAAPAAASAAGGTLAAGRPTP